MRSLVRMPLAGGGAILFDAPAEVEGPVKAGRGAEVVRELPQALQEALTPVRDTARAILEELRQAGPDEVEVEFGVDLSAEAGAVIAKSEAAVHLQVRLLWKNEERLQGID